MGDGLIEKNPRYRALFNKRFHTTIDSLDIKNTGVVRNPTTANDDTGRGEILNASDDLVTQFRLPATKIKLKKDR